jgi:AcrR family transcriptional regulator
MRRLAQLLDVTSTALYWHVKTKEDVLDLAVDRIFGDVPLPEPTDDWREDVRRLAHDWRGAMLRHPWSPSLIGRPMLVPTSSRAASACKRRWFVAASPTSS